MHKIIGRNKKFSYENDQFHPINNVKRSNTKDINDMETHIHMCICRCVCEATNIVAQFILLAERHIQIHASPGSVSSGKAVVQLIHTGTHTKDFVCYQLFKLTKIQRYEVYGIYLTDLVCAGAEREYRLYATHDNF